VQIARQAYPVPSGLHNGDGCLRLDARRERTCWLGKRPQIGGGCVCIVTDWTIRTPLAQMVCEPSVSAESWDLSFLAGIEVLLLTRARDAAYGEALHDALVDAGSPLVSRHVVSGADYGR